MPARIPQTIRDNVFQSWLAGASFRAIAIKQRISEGSVDNIVCEKKKEHGSDQINIYRELGVAMSKSGLSVQECADGHRVAMFLRNLGVDEEKFEGFIARLGKLYTNAGLGPEILANQIDDLHYFLEKNQNLSGAASVLQICNDINSKQAQNSRLQDEITVLESKKRGVEKDLSEIELQMSSAEAELGLTKEYKEKLKLSGLKKDDLADCIDLGRMVKGFGYSVHEITERFSSFAELEDSLASLHNRITHEGIRHDQLTRANAELEESNSKYSQRLRELVLLDKMGFGLLQFKQLRHLVEEIAEALGVPIDENAAVRWFFQNLVEHYHDYLDLGKTVQELESKIHELHTQRAHQLVALNLTLDVKEEVDSLVRMGVKKDDIKTIAKLIRQERLSKSRPPEPEKGDRIHTSQPTWAANRTNRREQTKHRLHPPFPKRIGLNTRSRKRSGEQNMGCSNNPDTQSYRQVVPSCPEILENSSKPNSSTNSIQQTRVNLDPEVKLAEVDACSFLDDTVTRAEVGKSSQLDEKRSAYRQGEVTSTRLTEPAAKEQTITERTDLQKEKSPSPDHGEAIDWGELLKKPFVSYLTLEMKKNS